MIENEMSFDEVSRIDGILYQLAMYEVSGGMLITPDSIEDVMKFQKKIASRFNYFKSLIRSGECTIEFLRSNVLNKNGPFIQEQLSEEDVIDKLIEESASAKNTQSVPNTKTNPIIDALMKKLLPSMNDADREGIIRDSGLGVVVLDDQETRRMLYSPSKSSLTTNNTNNANPPPKDVEGDGKKPKRKYTRKKKIE
jgi:hypothetical protein